MPRCSADTGKVRFARHLWVPAVRARGEKEPVGSASSLCNQISLPAPLCAIRKIVLPSFALSLAWRCC